MIKAKKPQPGELVPCCEVCLGTHRYEDNDGFLVCSTCLPYERGEKMKKEDIIAAAEKAGVINPKIKYGNFGLVLYGEGHEIREDGSQGWPLVWKVAEDLGISYGSGGAKYHQIKINEV